MRHGLFELKTYKKELKELTILMILRVFLLERCSSIGFSCKFISKRKISVLHFLGIMRNVFLARVLQLGTASLLVRFAFAGSHG